MNILTMIIKSPYFLWAILAIPSIGMIGAFTNGADAEGLLHPTGEFSTRFMIIAMVATPLSLIFTKAKWPRWLIKNRRYFGVAAFGYALLHTLFYIIDMGALQPMLDEFFALGIWTGWAAFVIFIPLALTSNNASQRWLLSKWKPLQRWVYAAAVLILIHWIFVHNNFGPALVHFIPLAGLELFRVWKANSMNRQTTGPQPLK